MHAARTILTGGTLSGLNKNLFIKIILVLRSNSFPPEMGFYHPKKESYVFLVPKKVKSFLVPKKVKSSFLAPKKGESAFLMPKKGKKSLIFGHF